MPLCDYFSSFCMLSILSWSWRSPSPVLHLSSWPPRRPWRAIVNSWEEPPLPFHAVHVFVPNHFNVVPDNWLRVSRHSGWSSLTSPDRPHCEEDQKYLTQPPPMSTRTLLSRRRAETSQPQRLDSEAGVVVLCSKFPGVAFMLGLYLTKMPSSM